MKSLQQTIQENLNESLLSDFTTKYGVSDESKLHILSKDSNAKQETLVKISDRNEYTLYIKSKNVFQSIYFPSSTIKDLLSKEHFRGSEKTISLYNPFSELIPTKAKFNEENIRLFYKNHDGKLISIFISYDQLNQIKKLIN